MFKDDYGKVKMEVFKQSCRNILGVKTWDQQQEESNIHHQKQQSQHQTTFEEDYQISLNE